MLRVRADEIGAGDFLDLDDGLDHMILDTRDLITGRIEFSVRVLDTGNTYTVVYEPNEMVAVRIF